VESPLPASGGAVHAGGQAYGLGCSAGGGSVDPAVTVDELRAVGRPGTRATMVIFFVTLQRYIVSGLVAGSVKG
jgi:hypothetical protein